VSKYLTQIGTRSERNVYSTCPIRRSY